MTQIARGFAVQALGVAAVCLLVATGRLEAQEAPDFEELLEQSA